jgi:hypothetical protein
MERAKSRARCALFAWPSHWEVRVLVDGQMVRSEDCRRGAEGFAVAEGLKNRMFDEGWTQIVPPGRRSIGPRVDRSFTLLTKQG